MKFEFDRVKNGVVLKVTFENGEEVTAVYQEPEFDYEDCEIERFAEFLWYVNDNFGPSTSRYSKKRKEYM